MFSFKKSFGSAFRQSANIDVFTGVILTRLNVEVNEDTSMCPGYKRRPCTQLYLLDVYSVEKEIPNVSC